MHLSLNALNRMVKPRVMRLHGTYGRKPIFILVDSNNTYNFRNEKTVYRLGCLLKPMKGAKVLVANGQKLLCNLVCEIFK